MVSFKLIKLYLATYLLSGCILHRLLCMNVSAPTDILSYVWWYELWRMSPSCGLWGLPHTPIAWVCFNPKSSVADQTFWEWSYEATVNLFLQWAQKVYCKTFYGEKKFFISQSARLSHLDIMFEKYSSQLAEYKKWVTDQKKFLKKRNSKRK